MGIRNERELAAYEDDDVPSEQRGARPSGTYPAIRIDDPPQRPVHVGFLLPDSTVLPTQEGIQSVRIAAIDDLRLTSKLVLNALVLDRRAAPDQFAGALHRLATGRGTWAANVGPRARAVYVLGTLNPTLAEYVAIAGMYSYPCDTAMERGLAIAMQRAAPAARIHAEHDPQSMRAWAEGTLGTWVGRVHPQLGLPQRTVLALAALDLTFTQIAEMLGKTERGLRYHFEVIRQVTGKRCLDTAGLLTRTLGLRAVRHSLIPMPIPEMPPTLDGSTPSLGLPLPETTR